MKIITTAVIKGGAGKTTTAAALAQAGAAAGKRVLAIDLDPQGNLTAALAADPQRPGSYELLTRQQAAADVAQESPQGMHVIAAGADLAIIKSKPGSAKRLREALKPIRERYDLIVIDTPPQIGELTLNALETSTGLLVPLETDTGSLQGLYNIEDVAQEVTKSNAALFFTGIILTRYDGRPKLNRYLRDAIKESAAAANIPYLGEIRAGIAVREAQAMQKSLFDYAPKSNPAADYLRLFNKIMED